MKKLLWIGGVITYLVVWVSPAGALPTVIDFGAFPATPQSTWTSDGVTFTPVGDGEIQKVAVGNPGPAITGTLVSGLFPTLRAEIAGGATFVSVDLGASASSGQTLFLQAYNAGGTLLDSAGGSLAASGADVETLSLNAPSGECIAYTVFGAVSDIGSSVFADNFTFEPCPVCPGVIPAPGALLLSMLGTGLIGHLRRRGTL